MIDAEKWQEENTRYLAEAVAAVRSRLKGHATAETPSVMVPETPPEPPRESKSVWRLFSRKQIAPSVTPGAVSPSETPSMQTGSVLPAASLPTSPDPGSAPPALVMLAE